jgi:hypothetical protein
MKVLRKYSRASCTAKKFAKDVLPILNLFEVDGSYLVHTRLAELFEKQYETYMKRVEAGYARAAKLRKESTTGPIPVAGAA